MPAFLASKLLGRRPRQTRKLVAKTAKSFFIDRGWTLSPVNGPLVYCADFIAKKGSAEIAVRCSGVDDRLLGSQVSDMREACLKGDFHPVYITGDHVDSRVLDQLYTDNSEALVSFKNLDRVESEINALRPVVVGAVDWIGLPNVVQGWAKLSPVPGPATILAQMKDKVLGSCDAAGFASTSPGHQSYGFQLKLSRELERREILGELRIKILYKGSFIKLLQIWEHAPVVDLR